MGKLLAASRVIDGALSRVASVSGWLFVALTFVIVVDVVTRRYGYQLPNFGSTRLQELEGHLHAALFSFWLGFAYIRNAHVRIDVAVARLNSRTRALIELCGCILFSLPFTLTALDYGTLYAWVSYATGEHSVSLSGLPYLFIPKAALALGIFLLNAAVASVVLRTLVFLYGPPELREQAAFASYRMQASEP
jgi:TRAP-type mannitol/chloroaromatic compound transport system permease small subunit